MGQYLPVLALGVLAFLFAIISILVSRLMAPRLRTPAKEAPYESGIVPSREPPQRFPVKFYLVAMIFLLFDIEVAFLYPFAMALRQLGWPGLIQLVLFFAIMLAGYVYVWRKGVLDWGHRAT